MGQGKGQDLARQLSRTDLAGRIWMGKEQFLDTQCLQHGLGSDPRRKTEE